MIRLLFWFTAVGVVLDFIAAALGVPLSAWRTEPLWYWVDQAMGGCLLLSVLHLLRENGGDRLIDLR